MSVPESMASTWIETDTTFSPFYRELQRRLEYNGVSMADSADSAGAVLQIHRDDTGQRVLSVSARNVPTEYEVFYSVDYSVVSGETVLLDRRELTLTRDYTYDSTQVLGKAREESLLRDAIVADLVQIVLRQIDAL